MRINEFFFLFVKSLNPANYPMLLTRKKREAVKYFIMLLFFSTIIWTIVSIPKFRALPDKVETALSKFESFNITGIDIRLMEPVVLLGHPRIVLDFSGNRTSVGDEMLVVTKSEIMWKKFKPNIFGIRLFETEKRQISEYSDVAKDVGMVKGIYWLLFILALPSLLFILFLLILSKY